MNELHYFSMPHPGRDVYHSGACWCKCTPNAPFTNGDPVGTVYWWSRLITKELPERVPA